MYIHTHTYIYTHIFLLIPRVHPIGLCFSSSSATSKLQWGLLQSQGRNVAQLRLHLSFLPSVSGQSHMEIPRLTCPCRYQNRHSSFQLPILWPSGTKAPASGISQLHSAAGATKAKTSDTQRAFSDFTSVFSACTSPIVFSIPFFHPSLPSAFFHLTFTLYLQCTAIFRSFPPSRTFLSITSLPILLMPS